MSDGVINLTSSVRQDFGVRWLAVRMRTVSCAVVIDRMIDHIGPVLVGPKWAPPTVVEVDISNDWRGKEVAVSGAVVVIALIAAIVRHGDVKAKKW